MKEFKGEKLYVALGASQENRYRQGGTSKYSKAKCVLAGALAADRHDPQEHENNENEE